MTSGPLIEIRSVNLANERIDVKPNRMGFSLKKISMYYNYTLKGGFFIHSSELLGC